LESNSAEDFHGVLRERKQEAADLEEKAKEAEKLEHELRDLRKDLGRFVDRKCARGSRG
jgi:cell division protein FtsB